MKSAPFASLLGLLTLTLLSSCTSKSSNAGPGQALKFTAIPNQNTTELAAKFTPLAKHLERVLGVPVEYVPTQDYAASVSLFKTGDVQLAWFGGLTGVQAREAVAGALAIAQGKIDPNFKSYFIANASLGLSRGPDFPLALAGKKFTFGKEVSTSGRLMPEYFIRMYAKQSPEEFFGTANHYSNGHDHTAELVQAGGFECGALDYKVYERLVSEGKIDQNKCVVVWESPTYVDYQWTAHPSLEATYGAGFTMKLQTALLALTEPALLSAMDRPEGLIAASNADYADLRTLAKDLGFLR